MCHLSQITKITLSYSPRVWKDEVNCDISCRGNQSKATTRINVHQDQSRNAIERKLLEFFTKRFSPILLYTCTNNNYNVVT